MRDQLLAAIMARLERIEAAQDPTLVLNLGALDDADRLARILRDDDSDTEALYALGWFHWYRCLVLPEDQDREALDEAIRVLTPCFIAGTERLPEPLLPLLAEDAVDTAMGLLEQTVSTDDLTLITATVSLWRRVVTATTLIDHPGRAARLSNLGGALRARFERVGAQGDLDEAITTLAQAAEVESGPSSIRIRAARVAAWLVAQTDSRRAADLLEAAVRLLPGTAPRQLDRSDQQYALGGFAGLVSDAATLALLADRAGPGGESPATRALGLLELGRGVMLGQALDTRSDLTDLQVRHPALAARFVELRDQLDQAGDTTVLTDDAGMVRHEVARSEWTRRWEGQQMMLVA